MNEQKITDPAGFLFELGNLHDVRLSSVVFDADNDMLSLTLDDISAAGLSEHQAPRPCVLTFRGVGSFLLDVETSEGIESARPP